MATSVQVVFDAADPERLGRFWATALGYVAQPPPQGFESWEAALEAFGVAKEEWDSAFAVVDPDGVGPRIYLQRVPESKIVKNRQHLDLNISGGSSVPLDERRRLVDAEVARLEQAGATVAYAHDDGRQYHVTMYDPEHNEFCVH